MYVFATFHAGKSTAAVVFFFFFFFFFWLIAYNRAIVIDSIQTPKFPRDYSRAILVDVMSAIC